MEFGKLGQQDEERRFDEVFENLPLDQRDLFSKNKIEITATLSDEGLHGANLDLQSKKELLEAVVSGDPKIEAVKYEILVRERERNREEIDSRRMEKAAKEFEKAGSPIGGAQRD